MKELKPIYKLNQRVSIILQCDKHQFWDADIVGIVGEPYENFIRYIVKFDNGKIEIYHEDDLMQIDKTMQW